MASTGGPNEVNDSDGGCLISAASSTPCHDAMIPANFQQHRAGHSGWVGGWEVAKSHDYYVRNDRLAIDQGPPLAVEMRLFDLSSSSRGDVVQTSPSLSLTERQPSSSRLTLVLCRVFTSTSFRKSPD
ncbi:hypothetical protein CPLU01_00925 [Colletotrichum plurivorum]|uniref:Uncharacterized protein n=1 Tax=Colletotrichum plurivorum TaxID=2175906 RepID=A0A8H6U4W9_9PEZI|nr:hypothetical protein CPLU01_00925 [Colletotrichum plurivorum]